MLLGETSSTEIFAFSSGLFLIPATAETLTAGITDGGFAGIRKTLKAHALGDGVNQWIDPAGVASSVLPGPGTDADNARRVAITLTNYRAIVAFVSGLKERFHIPLASIASVTRGRSGALHWVDVDTKLTWRYRVASENEVRVNALARELTVRMPRRLRDVFAYAASAAAPPPTAAANAPALPYQDPGWCIFNLEAELHRMIGGNARLLGNYVVARLTSAEFPTYPLEIVIPAQTPHSILSDIARFRQHGRIPSVSWIDGSSGAVLARAAQPLVGLYRRSTADEFLLQHLMQAVDTIVDPSPGADPTGSAASPGSAGEGVDGAPPSLFADNDTPHLSAPAATPSRVLHIIDCRSRAAAAANFAAGGGTEQTANLPFRAASHFLSLANIHEVQKSFTGLKNLCAAAQQYCRTWGDTRDAHGNFWEKLSETRWPALVMKLVFAANRVADCLDAGDPVVVHCTDGWDRTAQVCSLAMLLKDGYYRTVAGFAILIESEWLRMGHRFVDRCDTGLTSAQLADPTAPAPPPPNTGGDTLAHHLFSGAGLKDRFAGRASSSDEDSSDDGDGPSVIVSSAVPASPEEVTDARAIRPAASPVFLQWLDAVYQVMRAFPDAFEFTPTLLAVVGDAAYSGQFGTFLGNTHRARHQRRRNKPLTAAAKHGASVASTTPSLWTHIARRVHDERVNMNPVNPRDAPHIDHSERLINPFYGPDIHRETLPTATGGAQPTDADFARFRSTLELFGFPPLVLSSSAAVVARSDSTTGGAPQQRRGWRRLRPSFHSKRFFFWAAWHLKADFDAPMDLSPAYRNDAGRYAPGGSGIELFENPWLGSHVTVMSLLAAVTRQLYDAPLGIEALRGTARTPSKELDAATLIQEMWPAAQLDGTQFINANVIPCSDTVTGSTLDLDTVASPQLAHNKPDLPPAEEANEAVATTPLAHAAGYYIPREEASVCYLCEAPFTMFNRRHTCRACSRSVCGSCGGRFVVLPHQEITLREEKGLAGSRLRVCERCYVTRRTK